MKRNYLTGKPRPVAGELHIARGSDRETRGRYERMKLWLAQDLIRERVKLIDEVIGILTGSIVRMRKVTKG